jgi:AcrR family transcriptional regulator
MATKESPQQTRKAALLQAAIAVFSERGYQGATIDEIARRAGIAKGTTYLYYADKADLFYAVFEMWANDAIAGSGAALAAASNAGERLLALALGAVDYMEAHREWFPLSLEVWAASSTPALRERFAAALSGCYAGYRSEAAAIIRAGQAAGELRDDADADALAALLTGAIDGLFLQCWFDPALDARKLVQGFFDALLRGIAYPPEASHP